MKRAEKLKIVTQIRAASVRLENEKELGNKGSIESEIDELKSQITGKQSPNKRQETGFSGTDTEVMMKTVQNIGLTAQVAIFGNYIAVPELNLEITPIGGSKYQISKDKIDVGEFSLQGAEFKMLEWKNPSAPSALPVDESMKQDHEKRTGDDYSPLLMSRHVESELSRLGYDKTEWHWGEDSRIPKQVSAPEDLDDSYLAPLSINGEVIGYVAMGGDAKSITIGVDGKRFATNGTFYSEDRGTMTDRLEWIYAEFAEADSANAVEMPKVIGEITLVESTEDNLMNYLSSDDRTFRGFFRDEAYKDTAEAVTDQIVAAALERLQENGFEIKSGGVAKKGSAVIAYQSDQYPSPLFKINDETYEFDRWDASLDEFVSLSLAADSGGGEEELPERVKLHIDRQLNTMRSIDKALQNAIDARGTNSEAGMVVFNDRKEELEGAIRQLEMYKDSADKKGMLSTLLNYIEEQGGEPDVFAKIPSDIINDYKDALASGKLSPSETANVERILGQEIHKDVDDPEDENHDAQAEIDDAVALVMKPYGADLEELEQAINFLKALDAEGELEQKYRDNIDMAEQVLAGRMPARDNEKEKAIKNFATATDSELSKRESYLREMDTDTQTSAETEEWSLIIAEQENRRRGSFSADAEPENGAWFSTYEKAEQALTAIGYAKNDSGTFTKVSKKDALIKEGGVARGGFIHVVRTDSEVLSDKLEAIASATGRDKSDLYSQYKANEEKHGKEEADRLLDVTYAKLESYQTRLDELKTQSIDDIDAFNEAVDELIEELESKGLSEQYDADLNEILDRIDAIIEAQGV